MSTKNPSSTCTSCGSELYSNDEATVCVRCALGYALGQVDENFPTTPFPGATADEAAPAETIGPYRLLRVLGEGGMGVVWEAAQVEPVRRRVALKRLKLGLDGSQILARFESERQALAMMNHRNVAHALDAGRTRDGHPYFAMELVEGPWITRYCDAERLDLRSRLTLFVDVCRGIQHAHQKGIIHRDVKPSNVLVRTEDGRAVPKVIDFGVAKAIGEELTERTLMTRIGQRVGTLEYMSPEQAGAGAFDVVTRTDVYSLGTLLYELLTGRLPFEAPNGDTDELRRRIREDEPIRPSVRAAEPGPAAPETARRRGTYPAALSKSLRGDLDWIVVKALEKDRVRRYGSPDELAADIHRYLTNEPVAAGPPSAAYRARKFIRRHRGGMAATAGIVLALIAGTITSTTLYLRSEESRAEATAVAEFLGKMITDVNPSGGNKDVTVREVMDRASATMSDQFKSKPLVEAYLHEMMSGSYYGLGVRTESETHAQAAFDLRRRWLGDDDPLTLKSMDHLAVAKMGIGKNAEAAVILDALIPRSRRVFGDEAQITLDAIAQKATILLYGGQFREGEAMHRRVYEIRRRVLGADDPKTLESEFWLAQSALRQDRPSEAEGELRHLLEVQRRTWGPEYNRTLATMNLLAWALNSQGKHEEAEAFLAQVLEVRRRRLGDHHPDTLQAMFNLGAVRASMGDKAKAWEWLNLAAASGYANVPSVSQDKDVDSLRGTPEFERFLAALKRNRAQLLASSAPPK